MAAGAAMGIIAQLIGGMMGGQGQGGQGGQSQVRGIQPIYGNIGALGQQQRQVQQQSQGEGLIAAVLKMLMQNKMGGGTQYGSIGGHSINSSNVAPANYYLGSSTGL